jgi:two-component system, sensor histidine kinase ChiS
VIRNITQLGDSLDVSMSPVLIREIVEFAKRNLRRSWERKDETVRIREEFDPNLPTAFGNKHGLGTVLQQLIDNALKFSDREVIVRARVVGEKVELCVQDFGIGIMQDKLDAIFESFYQIDSSATRKYGGAGVGLAIVKLILDRHNAPIQVNSVVGEGSTFTFQLPIVDLRSTKR